MPTKTETLHVTGSSKDEINDSFNKAMKHYTQPGAKRPTEAITRRLRSESKAAFEALDASVVADVAAVKAHDEVAVKRAEKAAKAPKSPEPAKTAETAEKPVNRGGRPRVERFPYCPKCGYEFKKPQPRCNVPAACAKRAAARTEPVVPPKPVDA